MGICRYCKKELKSIKDDWTSRKAHKSCNKQKGIDEACAYLMQEYAKTLQNQQEHQQETHMIPTG